MNAKEEAKAAEERAIFEAFRACEGAPAVVAASIESRRPPEPDILCTITDQGPTGFELVEIVENEWAQGISNEERLTDSLYVKHQELGAPLAEAYGDALIPLRCQSDVGIRERENTIPSLFEFLTGLATGFKGDAEPGGTLAPIIRSVGISRGYSGRDPSFQVEHRRWLGDPTANTFQKKWTKNYRTEHPIELLAYWSLQPTHPETIGNVQRFVAANWATSPFRKVWIFDLNSNRILFDRSQ